MQVRSSVLCGRWVLAPPMLGDLVASADPDPVVAQDVIDETGKRGGASRLAGGTTMQSDGHDLRRLLALAVDGVEIVAPAPMAPITMSSPRRDRMSKLERRGGDGKGDRPTLLNGWDSELSEFARDSPLEGDGFELPVPGNGERCRCAIPQSSPGSR